MVRYKLWITKLKISSNGNYDYKNFNENEGLPNNTIHGIIEDKEGIYG